MMIPLAIASSQQKEGNGKKDILRDGKKDIRKEYNKDILTAGAIQPRHSPEISRAISYALHARIDRAATLYVGPAWNVAGYSYGKELLNCAWFQVAIGKHISYCYTECVQFLIAKIISINIWRL